MTAALWLLAALFAPDGPATAAKTTYYLGESKVTTADGKPLGNMASLVKREVKPAESKIVETVLMLSSRPGEPSKEYVAVFTVKGSTFIMKEQAGAFEGDGDLVGDPWAWTAWNSKSKIPGQYGGTLVSRDRLTERGMAVTKDLFSADGTPRVKMVEDYASIDGATYELLRAKLLPPKESK